MVATVMPIEERADLSALSLLLAWFSPAFPVGAFAYSHGLERLEADGAVRDRASTEAAVRLALTDGSGRTDAILLSHAHRAAAAGEEPALEELRTLALALAPSDERREEAVRQGNAFAGLVDAVWPRTITLAERGDMPLPVAAGAAGGLHGVPLVPLAHGYLSAFAANLVSAAVRLVPLGQTDGQRVTAALMPVVAAVTHDAVAAPLDDVGGAAIGLDLASMRHECQEVRLFRS
jgi:urease accessory protein